MDNELIQFKEVTKKFGKNVVLDSINLTIPEGKIIGIIGASGEGKSTILKMIASFYTPTKGEIYYKKKNLLKSRKLICKFFGLSIEDGSFYEKLTVKENLFHFGRLYNVKEDILKKRSEELISLVGLENAVNTLAKDLSLGMKKRLDIACSLIHNPTLLILDEPTSDLDILLRNQMIHLIKKINSHGTTIVLTTPNLSEIEELCDRIAILFNEKIIEEGEPSRIKSKYHAKNLNELFNKIFSKRERKTYQESTIKKSRLKLLNKEESLKKSLISDKEKFYSLFEKKDFGEDKKNKKEVKND
jgi:ABC-2 type transport system ATP-binding protein